MESWSDYISKLSPNERQNRYFSEQISKDYAKYRLPCFPELVEQILSYVNEKLPGKLHKALDVGCGPGQSTRVLAPYFEEVHGIDASPTQISEAKIHSDNEHFQNIFYQIGLAEKLPFENNSFQLITSSASFHWFDRDAFMKEVKRVLVPNGVLAVYSPGISTFVSDDLDLVERYKTILKEFWKTKLFPYSKNENFMDLYRAHCRELELPELKDTQRIHSLSKIRSAKLQDVISFVKTTLAYATFYKEDPIGAETAVQEVTQELLDLLQPATSQEEDCVITVENRNWCLMGRAQ